MGDITTGLEVASAGASLLGIGERTKAASQQLSAIREQQTQERIAKTQRSIDRENKLQKIIGSQAALAAAKGVNTASGSFKAITQQSFDTFNRDEKADALNLSFREDALEREEKEIRAKEFAGIFGDVQDFGEKWFDSLNLNEGGSGNNE